MKDVQKTLMKEIKDINWIISYVHGLEDFHMLKCTKYSKQSTDSVKFLSQSK